MNINYSIDYKYCKYNLIIIKLVLIFIINIINIIITAILTSYRI